MKNFNKAFSERKRKIEDLMSKSYYKVNGSKETPVSKGYSNYPSEWNKSLEIFR